MLMWLVRDEIIISMSNSTSDAHASALLALLVSDPVWPDVALHLIHMCDSCCTSFIHLLFVLFLFVSRLSSLLWSGEIELEFAAAELRVFSNAKNHRQDEYVPIVVPYVNPGNKTATYHTPHTTPHRRITRNDGTSPMSGQEHAWLDDWWWSQAPVSFDMTWHDITWCIVLLTHSLVHVTHVLDHLDILKEQQKQMGYKVSKEARMILSTSGRNGLVVCRMSCRVLSCYVSYVVCRMSCVVCRVLCSMMISILFHTLVFSSLLSSCFVICCCFFRKDTSLQTVIVQPLDLLWHLRYVREKSRSQSRWREGKKTRCENWKRRTKKRTDKRRRRESWEDSDKCELSFRQGNKTRPH